MGWRFTFIDRFIRWVVPHLNRAATIAILSGVASVFVSVATGFYVWENGREFDKGILHNKIIFSTIAITLWISALLIRLRSTDFLWHLPELSNLYVIVVVLAMGFTIFAGALGARLTFGHCFFDPLSEWIGWDPADPMYTSPGYSLLIAGAGLLFLLFYLRAWRRASNPGPQAAS